MRILKILNLIICFTITGCSYSMDMLEGSLTNRANFSIAASYDEDENILDISWTKSVSEEGFAGYEIYMILEPWNEFGTYEVIAASFDINPSGHFFRRIGSLGVRDTRSVSIRVTPQDLNGEGEYHVRLGIIKMAKDENDEYYPVTYNNYIRHSRLGSRSGYKTVYIQ
jgi:hypothetical protein